jgi:hypothetical protein
MLFENGEAYWHMRRFSPKSSAASFTMCGKFCAGLPPPQRAKMFALLSGPIVLAFLPSLHPSRVNSMNNHFQQFHRRP